MSSGEADARRFVVILKDGNYITQEHSLIGKISVSKTEDAGSSPAGPANHEHFYKWSEIKVHKNGGPKPTCRFCGQQRVG